MIRYAIEEQSKFVLKPDGKIIRVILKEQIISSHEATGIYLWVDEGTFLLVKSIYDNPKHSSQGYVNVIYDKQELHISMMGWPQPIVRPGTEVAILIPVASAYFGPIELEQIRIEWFAIETQNNIK